MILLLLATLLLLLVAGLLAWGWLRLFGKD
jgi:hypothetical protein